MAQSAEEAALIAVMNQNYREAERIIEASYPGERQVLQYACSQLARMCERLADAPTVEE